MNSRRFNFAVIRSPRRRASSEGGISRLSAFAVFRLIARSYLSSPTPVDRPAGDATAAPPSAASNSLRLIDGTRPLRQNQNASPCHGRDRLLLQLGSIEEVEELLRSRRAAADIL